MNDLIHNHGAKVGVVGTVATFTLEQWSALAGLTAGIVTVVCLVPVAVTRWRKLLKGQDVDTST